MHLQWRNLMSARFKPTALDVRTPAFVYDILELQTACRRFELLRSKVGLTQLFPLKCHTLYGSLQTIAQHVDGLAVSSLFEATLARSIVQGHKPVYYTSPGLRDDEVDELFALCDGIAFNSLTQWARFRDGALGRVTCGLRVNPQLPLVKDARYDPCRRHSRLGLPLTELRGILGDRPEILKGIEGLHFHTNCDAADWRPLLRTTRLLDASVPELLHACRWVNLGGGYLLGPNTDVLPLIEAAEWLQTKYGLDVIIEPGAAMVRDACYLISRVLDLFTSDGIQVAVLDTSVNHMPEVFEYQFSPDVLGDREDGVHSYLLAGCSCLAGDVFGEYAFDEPLAVGGKVAFTGVGAYTLVKAHMFNGVNLPSIYALSEAGDLRLERQFGYGDFANGCGAVSEHESIRKNAAGSGSPGQC
jgi:carboxynorspermidine decarboxylase